MVRVCFFLSLGLCWTAKTFPADAGNQTEEAVRRRAGKKPAAVASQDSNFRLSRKLVLDQKSSPYFTRGEPSINHPSGAALLREEYSGDSEVTLEGQEARSEEEVLAEAENMSEQGVEAVGVIELLRIMVERDTDRNNREEARRVEEEQRRKAEEEARLNEIMEMFKQMNEVEQDRADRCKAEEIERCRAEAEATKDRREEDDKKRDKRERLKERLEGLGMYKETSDLGWWYIEKFERIMRDCEVEVEKWVEKLVTRLGERLYVRISSLMDEGAAYEVIREALMKAVGETPITYGHRIFEMSGGGGGGV